MIKSVTISVEEDSGSTMQHTVSTKEEALALIDRYFKESIIPEVKIGDKARILTDGGFDIGEKYVGSVHVVEALYGTGGVGLRTGMYGTSDLWAYYPDEYELVKE